MYLYRYIYDASKLTHALVQGYPHPHKIRQTPTPSSLSASPSSTFSSDSYRRLPHSLSTRFITAGKQPMFQNQLSCQRGSMNY